LRESLQFAGRHLLTSLVAFNLGVELGQLLVLALLVPVLGALFRFVVAERTGTIILSALAAHTGWHWMLDRAAVLRRFGFEVPWAALACAVAFGIAALLMVVYASTAALRALRRVLYERQSRITAPVP
jgi:ABC-type antimicrobial peptide transport system permease subunit